jgi:uncharacterized membrane protein YccC
MFGSACSEYSGEIAGSSGETLRRIAMRILGTVGGVALGFALALILPNELAIVVAVATYSCASPRLPTRW